MPFVFKTANLKMYRSRLEAVADAIEKHALPNGVPLAFDMTVLLKRGNGDGKTGHVGYCAGCIAGFAALMFGRPQDIAYLNAQDNVNIVAVDLIAQHALGLSDDEAAELFYGTKSGTDISKVTAIEAAQTLRRAVTCSTVRHEDASLSD